MRVPSFTRRVVRLSAALTAGILVVGSGVGAADATHLSTPSATVVAAADRTGPQFYAGTAVDVTGTVDGDVYAAGQSVTISGDVTGDVIAAAQTITISGTVEGNVRLAGQDIRITGDVGRSGTVFGSNVVVGEAATLGDDLVAGASEIRIAGDVGRDMFLTVGALRIDGTVGGDVTYTSSNRARIADGAVQGTVKHIESSRSRTVEVSPWAVFLAWFLGVLYALVALSLITLCAGLLVPRWLARVTDHLVPSPWKALLVGFLAAIVVPPALLFLLVTIVGAPLALGGLLVWVLLTLATFVYGAFYLGRLVLRGNQHPVLKSFVGGLILIVGLQIPWLNILVWLAMVFFGLGAQLLEFYSQRPWSTKAAPAPAPDTTQGGSA
ncbi:MAG: hypothetical protein J0I97_05015 [Microbacterium sp.]|nr:hypothetical protein [Microbacterium sp.]